MFNQSYLELFTNQWRDISLLSEWIEKNKKHHNKIDELEHICDYFMWIDNPNYSLSFTEANRKAKAWVKSMQLDTTDEKEWEDYEVVYQTSDWLMKFVKLLTQKAYENESSNMRHCIRTYWWNDREVFSLRDISNKPHATMDIVRWEKKIMQIQWKGDNTVDGKYQDYNIEFLSFMWFDIESRFMEKIWYIDISVFLKHIKKDSQVILNKYIRKENINEYFDWKIKETLQDITDDTIGILWSLDLRGYNHPLPAWFTSCGWWLDLQGYNHPLPAWFTSCGWWLDLRDYNHPLPAWFTSCGWSLDLRDYNHPLPAWFTSCGWSLPSGFNSNIHYQ